jgi:hypothetical protein
MKRPPSDQDQSGHTNVTKRVMLSHYAYYLLPGPGGWSWPTRVTGHSDNQSWGTHLWSPLLSSPRAFLKQLPCDHYGSANTKASAEAYARTGACETGPAIIRPDEPSIFISVD